MCIVGGGFTGVSAALHLAERGYDVILLEQARIGWGASGRNGGQMNTGFRIGPAGLVERFGREQARRLWAVSEEAKATIRERVARHAIACDLKAGTLQAAVRAADFAAMEPELAAMQQDLDYSEARLVSPTEIGAMVDSRIYFGGLYDGGGGHLHPLNFVLGLARAAEENGARIVEQTRVSRIESGPTAAGQIAFVTASGVVRARQGILACDAYLEQLAPPVARMFIPISSYVLATEPLGDLAQRLIPGDLAVCDTKFVVDYYRLSGDGRLLFGGGETYTSRAPADLKAFVRRPMLRVFPQLARARIDYAWGGRVGITRNRLPHFGRLAPNLFFAQGYSGQGVALATMAGKLMSEAIAGTAERFDLMERLPHAPFPGGTALRQPLQVLGMLFYALRDRL